MSSGLRLAFGGLEIKVFENSFKVSRGRIEISENRRPEKPNFRGTLVEYNTVCTHKTRHHFGTWFQHRGLGFQETGLGESLGLRV